MSLLLKRVVWNDNLKPIADWIELFAGLQIQRHTTPRKTGELLLSLTHSEQRATSSCECRSSRAPRLPMKPRHEGSRLGALTRYRPSRGLGVRDRLLFERQ